jgi:hypothetical protein
MGRVSTGFTRLGVILDTFDEIRPKACIVSDNLYEMMDRVGFI